MGMEGSWEQSSSAPLGLSFLICAKRALGYVITSKPFCSASSAVLLCVCVYVSLERFVLSNIPNSDLTDSDLDLDEAEGSHRNGLDSLASRVGVMMEEPFPLHQVASHQISFRFHPHG